MQLATLQSRLLAVADRDAEELNEARREFDERVAAMRAQLEQQEVDNAALLDVVQVLCSVKLIMPFSPVLFPI